MRRPRIYTGYRPSRWGCSLGYTYDRRDGVKRARMRRALDIDLGHVRIVVPLRVV